MRSLIILAVAFSVVGCRSRDTQPGVLESRRSADEARCEVARGVGESAECYAVRCAEDFVLRSGYTIDPPSGTEHADPLGIPLAQRHGMLYGSAIVHRWSAGGHFVGFRYRDSSDNVGRAVTMSRTFRGLQLDHLNFVWAPDSRLPTCAPDAG